MQIIKDTAFFVSLIFLTACSESGLSNNDLASPPELNNNTLANTTDIEADTAAESVSENTTDTTVETTTETTAETIPNEPEGLRGVVYTDTEIEIFWDRSDDTSIINYTVSRDGTALSTTDALSYYDNTVVSGTTYEYTLQAVDNNGVHSNPASLFLTTPAQAPTINATNALTLLEQVTTVINGRLFAREFRDLYTSTLRRQTLIDNGFEIDSIETNPSSSSTNTYNCDQQGQFSLFNNANSRPSFRGEFQNCGSVLFDNESINGEYELKTGAIETVWNSGFSNYLELDTIVTTDSNNRSRTLTGFYETTYNSLQRFTLGGYNQIVVGDDGLAELDENGNLITIPKPFNYVSQAFEGETRVKAERIHRTRGALQNTENSDFSDEWNHTLSAEFTLQSPGTGNKLISITTPEPLHTNTIGGCFEQGQLKITAADGSELLLEANNGNANTATLHVTADGVMSQETIDWNSELLLLYATPNDVYGHTAHPLDDLPSPEDCTGG